MIKIGSKVSVLTANNQFFTGVVTGITSLGFYIVDNNSKFRQDWKGEWFSSTANSIKLTE